MSEWQPIETAPTDGTKVLLGRFAEGTINHGRVRVDWYRTTDSKSGFTGFGYYNSQFWPATHWMPLPDPPVNSAGNTLSGNNRDLSGHDTELSRDKGS